MRLAYTVRSMAKRPHNALAHRHLRPYRLIITLGDTIAAIYFRLPLRLDYDFASHRFSVAILRISLLSSGGIGGRPALLFQRQRIR